MLPMSCTGVGHLLLDLSPLSIASENTSRVLFETGLEVEREEFRLDVNDGISGCSPLQSV